MIDLPASTLPTDAAAAPSPQDQVSPCLEARRGEAFEQVVRTHGGRLLQVARRYLPEEDARDAVQDGLLSAFRSIDKLQGWAVMVKTSADSARGDGWFWYEVTDTEDGSKPVAAGNGVGLCTGCHFTGNDFVSTQFPLR